MNTVKIFSSAHKKSQRASGQITKLGLLDLPNLARRLAVYNHPDPYLTSAAYYGFTGRNGLWIYEEGEDFIPFCNHPNVPGKIIVFPSISPHGVRLTWALLKNHFIPTDNLQLGRLTPHEAAEYADQLSWTTKGYFFQSCEEPILDWLFPIHTLSTSAVTAHTGGAFKIFRNYLHRVDMSRISVQDLDFKKDFTLVLNLTRAWAEQRSKATGRSFPHLFDPHAYMIQMAKNSGLNIQGNVIFMDGICVSYSIWEMPSNLRQVASSIAAVSHGPCKGIAELQQLERCRALYKKGIERVCIGGSETPGLDAYKRKLNPVESLNLKSISIAPNINHTPYILPNKYISSFILKSVL